MHLTLVSKHRALLALLAGIAPLAALFFTASARGAGTELPVELRAELDYAMLSAAGEDTAVLKISLLPHEVKRHIKRPPLNLAIVLDRSGSMSGSKIEMAKKAAARAFESLRPDDRVSIISYSDSVETLLPLTPVRYVHNPDTYIERILAGGGTAIYAGVNQAAAELRRETSEGRAINRVLLLSDGLANQGPSTPNDFKLLGRSLSREGITVSTIGLGLDYNEDLMASLSAAGQGNVYFVESPRDLPHIFESELGDASSLVARDAIIELECAEGFEPIRILGRDGRIHGNKVTIEISHLYAGHEMFALVEVRNAGGEAKSERTIATVQTRIHDLTTDSDIVLNDFAKTTFTDDESLRQSTVNLEVQRDVVENKIALAQEEAIIHADRGDLPRATAVMKNLDAWITTNNATWNDKEIAESAYELEARAQSLEQDGMDKRARKEMRSSSYQIRSQQKSK